MIKAVATTGNGEKLVLLGLSDANIVELKKGNPILIEMWELGFEGKLAIMAGGTEDELAQLFKDNMDIPPGTLVDERKPEKGH